ncbi:MAG: SUMF1/EgtB/PvdO family nonheme iron enzyme, partial [Caldilineaceae bacterium]|nr:SUMF1/EgtB/PvdO family nonheme iron enzyme [Caldilineaceae bacterium]
EGAADTRRRVALDQLVTTAAQRAQVDAVLAELTKARLVITGEEASPDTDTEHRAHAEVAHEALIREWPQLRRWLEENRESLRLQRNLEDAAKHWEALGRDTGALYSGIRLQQALTWQSETDLVLTPQATAFLQASKRRRDIWRSLGATVAVALFAVLGWLSWRQINEMRYEQLIQAVPTQIAEGNAEEAKAKLRTADALFPDRLDLETQLVDINREVAIQLVQQGEMLAHNGDRDGADENFRAALALGPPFNTPVYVWVPPGEFMMGSSEDDELAYNDEKPLHPVNVGGFWLMRTEVTNAQYRRCVGENEEGPCTPPDNQVWQRPEFTNRPVTDVTWEQAQVYAAWVGGRLPTEAEWEKTCRGGSEIPVNPQKAWEDMKANPYPQRIYPWGNGEPHPDLLNYYGSQIGTTTDVGRYLNGASPYGVLDMGGNVFEWTGSVFKEYPYDPNDGHEEPASSELRVVRGGSFVYLRDSVRCAFRDDLHPDDHALNVGFRILSPGP